MRIDKKGVDTMIKYFDVYKSSKGYYVKDDVCKNFGINTNDTRIIKNVVYYKVPEETIASIEETTKNEAIQYLRNELALFDLQIVLTIKILVDIISNKKYISQTNANKFNIIGKNKTIDNIVYVEITDNKIQEIIDSTKNGTITYKIEYEEVELEEDGKPAKHLFIYYHDLSNNTLYITRKILESIKALGIELETTPKIVDNRNCYSITQEKLKEFESKSSDYRGIERIIKLNDKKENPFEIFNDKDILMPYNNEISTVKDEDLIPYDEKISNIFDETSIAYKIKLEVDKALEKLFTKKSNEIKNELLIPYDDNLSSVVDETVIPYDDRISKVFDYKEIEAIKQNVKLELQKYLKKQAEEKIIPYNDEISTIYDESILANRISYEINKALKACFDKKTLIDNKNIIIVYKDLNTGKLFIPEKYAKTKINLETIMNKRCYETTEKELESIYNKRFLIIGVFIRPKKKLNITICNNDGDLYISNKILRELNIVSNYSKMILVNKEIFTQIGNEELDKIESLDLDNSIVNIEIKKIVKIDK